MKDEICRSCIDCAVTRCDNHTSNRPYPAFCVSKQVSDAQREASLQQYLTDEEDRKLAQVAAGIESDGYRKWPRVQETILFAKRMGYHKIGIATCVALIRESRTLAKMLRANGFEVFGVGCKTGEIFKTALGIDAAFIGANGILDGDVSTSNMDEGRIQQLAFSKADSRYLIADSSKIGKRDFYTFCRLDSLDAVVCEPGIAAGNRAAIEEHTQVIC